MTTLALDAWIPIAIAAGLILMIGSVLAQRCFVECPANKLLVIYGKMSGGETARCVHGGSAFVMPIFQHYLYMSLEPMEFEIASLTNASDGAQVRAEGKAMVAIRVKRHSQPVAVKRLLGLEPEVITAQARGIVVGSLDATIAQRTGAEVGADIHGVVNAARALAKEQLKLLGLDILRLDLDRLDVTPAVAGSE